MTDASLIHPVNLGPLVLAHNLALAPMHKRTHLPFRLLARRCGAALTHTEMATPEDLLGHISHKKAQNLLAASPEDRPLGVQILPRRGCGALLAEAVAMVAGLGTADLVDLNFACPSKRVAGSGRGGAFLKDPDAALPLVEAAVRASALPVTLKLRIGWTDGADDRARALALARGAVAAGAAGITLHGRSVIQHYHGAADWDAIGQWAADLPVPVLGSGDLKTPEMILDMLRRTGAAGAHVARGAFGKPWIFRQTLDLAAGGAYAPATPALRGRTLWEHFEGLVDQFGDALALKFICQVGRMYARDIARAAEARTAIQNARTRDGLAAVVGEYFGEGAPAG
jgi:nifR3 family TIM-barrel protein